VAIAVEHALNLPSMTYYWPAPLDLIDPCYDFHLEKGRYGMRQQQQQLLPHEVLGPEVYQGILISKAHVQKGHMRWNTSQVNRLLREGAKRFLRIGSKTPITIMGDSGAYTIDNLFESSGKPIDQCIPVFDFYSALGVDFGLAPDRVISGLSNNLTGLKKGELSNEWQKRWFETIDLADAFWGLCKRRSPGWEPVGVAQGWDAPSYKASVNSLEQIGYSYIALGGLNSLRAERIMECVEACSQIKQPTTRLHLLGISRIDYAIKFSNCGVTSFDSATPIRQAVKDRNDNYHGLERNYMAIKLPQANASPRLQSLVRDDSSLGKRLLQVERESMSSLRDYDKGSLDIESVLSCLQQGALIRKEEDNTEDYRRLLTDMPWKTCACSMCQEIGIEIVLLRNRERNLRRSFHNLYVFAMKMRREFPGTNS
jgi:hypothetical protein